VGFYPNHLCLYNGAVMGEVRQVPRIRLGKAGCSGVVLVQNVLKVLAQRSERWTKCLNEWRTIVCNCVILLVTAVLSFGAAAASVLSGS
jgi:hypothetical protein